MTAAVIIVIAIIWIGLAYLFAKIGEHRGHGFTGFFLLGLFLTPILTGTVILIDTSRQGPPSTHERLLSLQKLHESGALSDEEYAAQHAALQPPPPPAPAPPPPPPPQA